MGIFSKVAAVSTLGASTLATKAVQAGIAHQANKLEAAVDPSPDELVAETPKGQAKYFGKNSIRAENFAAKQQAVKDAETVRVWTLTSRPGHVAAELQKEIIKQAREGFALTSQSTTAGHSRTRTLQVVTAIFTRTVA